MYSTHNEKKSVFAERFVRRFVIDVKDSTYIHIDKEVNNKSPKLKFGDHVRISKFKTIYAKGYTPNWSQKDFVI